MSFFFGFQYGFLFGFIRSFLTLFQNLARDILCIADLCFGNLFTILISGPCRDNGNGQANQNDPIPFHGSFNTCLSLSYFQKKNSIRNDKG
jgi:hypothetical protein